MDEYSAKLAELLQVSEMKASLLVVLLDLEQQAPSFRTTQLVNVIKLMHSRENILISNL